jgi:hypothetical protein
VPALILFRGPRDRFLWRPSGLALDTKRQRGLRSEFEQTLVTLERHDGSKVIEASRSLPVRERSQQLFGEAGADSGDGRGNRTPAKSRARAIGHIVALRFRCCDPSGLDLAELACNRDSNAPYPGVSNRFSELRERRLAWR